ncbi:MAG: hypothetical protein IJN70_09310 [Clostridia bacterium]|nr:hypothetical protein [Clostridia bacterium]
MPYIDVKLSKSITDAEAVALKAELGSMIEVFPGKSEGWLMCSIEDSKKMWFKGDNSDDSAFVEVKLYGTVNPEAADKFTGLLCNYLEEKLSISSDRIYVRYEGGSDWGWNGSNF